MFPDGAIAKEFSLGSDKMFYHINFGMAVYFKDEFKSSKIVYHADFIKIAQKGQIDIVLIYFDNKEQKVSTFYYTSVFSQSAEAFKTGIASLPLQKMVNILMDEASVNWKFLYLLKKDLW